MEFQTVYDFEVYFCLRLISIIIWISGACILMCELYRQGSSRKIFWPSCYEYVSQLLSWMYTAMSDARAMQSMISQLESRN